MEAIRIDGKESAQVLRDDIAKRVAGIKAQSVDPCLAVILVGENPASVSYVTGKEAACLEVGITARDFRKTADCTQDELVALVEQLNNDPSVHGILVQLPLPPHIQEDAVIAAIDPRKDVDGFHPVNVGNLALGKPGYYPCTPYGVIKLLELRGLETRGKHVVIVGRSNIVGKPMASLLLQKGPYGDATVTICHSRTQNLPDLVRQADVVIAAIGSPEFVSGEWIKPGAIVIDVGVNRVSDSTKKSGFRLVGDVNYATASMQASYITPVPGGVGPMTITMLLWNTLEAAFRLSGAQR